MKMTRRIGWMALCVAGAISLAAPTAQACEISTEDRFLSVNPGVPPQFAAAACSGGDVERVSVHATTYSQVVTLEVSDRAVAESREQHFAELLLLFARETDLDGASLEVVFIEDGPPMTHRPSLWVDDTPVELTKITHTLARFQLVLGSVYRGQRRVL